MSRRTVFLFAGQGSQYYQMGRGLYEHDPVFRAEMDALDRVPQALAGVSVLKAMYGGRGKGEPFDALGLTHPAIFMVEFALAQAVRARGVQPACVLGSSLGIYAALAVAGALGAEEALAMVVRQAQVVERHGPRGGMVGVLHAPRLFEDSEFLRARASLAGRNFESHFVLSAPQANIDAIEGALARAGAAHQWLPVPYPFHSAWIDPMREAFIDACPGQRVAMPALPVVCCAAGGALGEVTNDYFWRVAREPMYFMPAVAGLEAAGAHDYLDLSPSGTLAGFLRYLKAPGSASRVRAALSPFGRGDMETLDAALAALR